MKIKLENGYVLNGDAYNYWLGRMVKPEDKSKQEYERICSGYFRNVEDVFQSALRRAIMDNDAENFRELIKHVDKAKRELKKAAKGLNDMLKAKKEEEQEEG